MTVAGIFWGIGLTLAVGGRGRYASGMDWEFVICSGCGGADVAQSVASACPGVSVRQVGCLSVCNDPVTVAVQGAGRATYVFSGIGPQDAGDIAAFAAAYSAAPGGWIEDARPLGRLRFRLVTRVPAMG